MDGEFGDEAVFQIYGRLSAHESMLVTLYALYFSQMKPEDAEDFVRNIERQMKTAFVSEEADQRAPEGVGLQVARDSQVMASRLLQKALKQAAVLRAK